MNKICVKCINQSCNFYNNKKKNYRLKSCEDFESEKDVPLVAGAYITVEGKLKDIIPLAKEATEPEKEAVKID